MTIAPDINPRRICGPPDLKGECAACHADMVWLWIDATTVQQGGFAYCEKCMKELLTIEHIRKANTRK